MKVLKKIFKKIFKERIKNKEEKNFFKISFLFLILSFSLLIVLFIGEKNNFKLTSEIEAAGTQSQPEGSGIGSINTNVLNGWLWSNTIGWLRSMAGTNYKVIAGNDGKLNGYMWSSNIGWVKFGGLSNCPSGNNCDASLYTYTNPNNPNDPYNGKIFVSGWARACSALQSTDCSGNTLHPQGGGWDGWINLFGAGSSNFLDNPIYDNNAKKITGFSWGGNVIGWLKWMDVPLELENVTPPPLFPPEGPEPIIPPSTALSICLNANPQTVPIDVGGYGISNVTWKVGGPQGCNSPLNVTNLQCTEIPITSGNCSISHWSDTLPYSVGSENVAFNKQCIGQPITLRLSCTAINSAGQTVSNSGQINISVTKPQALAKIYCSQYEADETGNGIVRLTYFAKYTKNCSITYPNEEEIIIIEGSKEVADTSLDNPYLEGYFKVKGPITGKTFTISCNDYADVGVSHSVTIQDYCKGGGTLSGEHGGPSGFYEY